MKIRKIALFTAVALLGSFSIPGARAAEARPTLWLIGDSTVNNGTKGQSGWGEQIGVEFDPARITVANRARGGRSSRTFFTEGLWADVLKGIKPGDFVMMQFGHNDGGKVSGELSPGRPARASLKGNGNETVQAEIGTTGKEETVHSYGWYLRTFISEAKKKGATAIVLSPIPRNDWKDGHVLLASGDYGKWAAEAARAEGVEFIDLNGIVAKRYEELGQEKVKAFFPNEHTHTNVAGAQINAQSVISGLKGLDHAPLAKYLSAAGEAIPASPAGAAR